MKRFFGVVFIHNNIVIDFRAVDSVLPGLILQSDM